MRVVGASDGLASNESSQFLSCFEAIHDGHVAVHEDDSVGGRLLATNAWFHESILIPLHYLVYCFLAVQSLISLYEVSSIENRLQGDDVKYVIVYY